MKMKRIISRIRHIDTDVFWFKTVIFLIVAIVIASFFYVHSERTFDIFTDAVSADEPIKMDPGMIIRQDIPSDAQDLTAISIQYGTYGKRNKGNVIVSLYEDDRMVQEWNYTADRLVDNAYQTYYLDHLLHMSPEHSYYFTVTDEYEEDNGVAVWTSIQSASIPLFKDNEELSGNMVCFRVGHTKSALKGNVLAIATVIFVCVLAAIIFGLNEKVLMSGVLVTLGIVFFWLCPLGMAPDEGSHFLRAFEVSCLEPVSKHIGETGSGGSILPAMILEYEHETAEIDWNDTTEFTFGNTALYSPMSYVPQVIGIRLARFFTNNVHAIFYAGRWGNFIASMMLCIAALWMVPYGRKVIFMAMLFPLSLQEMVSMAPDGFIIGLSMFLLAYVLGLGYREEKLKVKDFVILTIICIELSQCKIVYVVLLFLIFIIPKEKVGNLKRNIVLKLGVPAAAVILNLIWLVISSGFLVEFQPGVDSGPQIRYVLTHLPQYYLIAVRTTLVNGPFYINSMIGNSMGALNIGISGLMWIAFLILYVYEISTSHDMINFVRRRDKYIMLFIFFACVALIYTSLYVQWTPYKNFTVNGVQGRYFIPIISLLAFWAMYVLHEREVKAGNAVTYETKGTYYYVLLLTFNGITVLDMI